LRDLRTVEGRANSIQLQRQTYSGNFLLFEGTLDMKFYRRFINENTCMLSSYEGKEKVIAVLAILEQRGFQGALAIVDADFDRLVPPKYQSLNLLLTDTHDLETMLIQSPALEKVLFEFGSKEKIEEFGRDVRQTLLDAGTSIGYLLFVSRFKPLNLKFEGITFSDFINKKSLVIDENAFLQEVKNKSQAFGLKIQDLQQDLTQQKNAGFDPWQVCCGHDLIQILSIGLQKALGTKNSTDVKVDILERDLRLAYEKVDFLATQLYSDIQAWEIRNNQNVLI
jgi:Protein of unknown function (DUF4435)